MGSEVTLEVTLEQGRETPGQTGTGMSSETMSETTAETGSEMMLETGSDTTCEGSLETTQGATRGVGEGLTPSDCYLFDYSGA